jgi:hypothetical protein
VIRPADHTPAGRLAYPRTSLFCAHQPAYAPPTCGSQCRPARTVTAAQPQAPDANATVRLGDFVRTSDAVRHVRINVVGPHQTLVVLVLLRSSIPQTVIQRMLLAHPTIDSGGLSFDSHQARSSFSLPRRVFPEQLRSSRGPRHVEHHYINDSLQFFAHLGEERLLQLCGGGDGRINLSRNTFSLIAEPEHQENALACRIGMNGVAIYELR